MTIYTKFYISNTQHFFETNHSIICLAEGENAHKKILKFIKIHENENLNIDILHSFEHENIIKPENEFRYNEFYCLVFPFTNQQSLNHLLRTQYPDGLPEQLSSKIFYQILNAVQYLHIMNVCHNDITCDKVLVFNTDPVQIILLLSRYTSIILPNQHKDTYCGNPNYVAPEIFTHTPFDNRVDIWSLGILLFVMLSGGHFPFHPISRFPQSDLDYSILEFMNVSNDAIDLIKKMCQFDPDKRISIQKALVHPWIKAHHEEYEGNQVNIYDILYREEYEK